MKLEDIYYFFTNKPVTYLSTEQAVCYVLSVLLERESYGRELIQKLENEYPNYRLSDTVLYAALKFLEQSKAIAGYWKKLEGPGRLRRMYKICPEWHQEAQKLATLWMNSAAQKPGQEQRVCAV